MTVATEKKRPVGREKHITTARPDGSKTLPTKKGGLAPGDEKGYVRAAGAGSREIPLSVAKEFEDSYKTYREGAGAAGGAVTGVRTGQALKSIAAKKAAKNAKTSAHKGKF